ncbi:HAD hydrolase-like protein [Streptomyces sp. NPDC055893]
MRRAFLELHGLEEYVTKIVGHPSEQQHMMKPNPFPLITAAEQKHIDVTSCTLIGESLTDIQTSHASGATVIDYANKPHKGDQFTEAQADITTEGHAGHRRRTHRRAAQGTRGSCYRFLYLIKARARRGRAPPLRRGLPPVCGPAGRARRRAACMRVRAGRHPRAQDDASGGGSAGTGMEGAPFPAAGAWVARFCGLPSRPPSTQAEPSRRGPGRTGWQLGTRQLL